MCMEQHPAHPLALPAARSGAASPWSCHFSNRHNSRLEFLASRSKQREGTLANRHKSAGVEFRRFSHYPNSGGPALVSAFHFLLRPRLLFGGGFFSLVGLGAR